MINELQLMSRALEKYGIQVPSMHPWIKGVRQGEALLVNLTGDGVVNSLEYCSPEQVKLFWSIDKSNHETFPKINVDPLWKYADVELRNRIVDAGKRKGWVEWFLGIEELMANDSQIHCKETPEEISKWRKGYWRRLYKFSHESILPYLSSHNKGLSELIHCFDSFEAFDEFALDRLFMQIARMLMDNLKSGRMDCFKLAQNLLIGSPITMIFNHDTNRILVTNEDEAKALGNALSSLGNKENIHLCPVTGKMTEAVTDIYPNPRLPVIGDSYLMAMNDDAPCHSRYGKIGADIFPASKTASFYLDNVMRYMTSEDRKFKTWMSIASGKWEGNPKKEVRDLLLCYAEEIPALQNVQSALLIGGDSGFEEQRFESISTIVCDALRTNNVAVTNSKLSFFVIRKISKGQSQVVFNDYCAFTELVEAVRSWSKAADNHPPYAQWLPTKNGGKAAKTEPWTPFPADLIRLLQYQWIRDGMESSKLDGCSLIAAYDLFFDRGSRTRSTAKQVLGVILQRTKSLLIGINKQLLFETGKWRDIKKHEYNISAKIAAIQAISFLGIILFRLGHKKEKYMKSAGYNIGRLLSLADLLHREYCRHVRKGDIANNLLGNTLMQTVLDNPVRGLARLSERIAVYIAPFDRLYGEEYRLAGWARNQIGIIAEQLSNEELPGSTNDVMKAQILLGYLAHSESTPGDNHG